MELHCLGCLESCGILLKGLPETNELFSSQAAGELGKILLKFLRTENSTKGMCKTGQWITWKVKGPMLLCLEKEEKPTAVKIKRGHLPF